MAEKKVIFVAFAIEDERQRDFLKGQSLNTKSPFEYVDMSVKEAYSSEWKERVRTRIRGSLGSGLPSCGSRKFLTPASRPGRADLPSRRLPDSAAASRSKSSSSPRPDRPQ